MEMQEKRIWYGEKIRAVAGQHSSPELSFANKTKMFFRAEEILFGREWKCKKKYLVWRENKRCCRTA